MTEPIFDVGLRQWYVQYEKARWWFSTYEAAQQWYLDNKGKY